MICIRMMLIVEPVRIVRILILKKGYHKEEMDMRQEQCKRWKADRKVKMSGLHLQASRRVNVLG
jgi:hypothetical protein